jgi:hypothetical protein
MTAAIPASEVARPVHGDAFRRQDTILPHVEPALSGQPVPHLDQAHLVIAVGAEKQVGNLRRRPHRVQGDERQSRQADQPERPGP